MSRVFLLATCVGLLVCPALAADVAPVDVPRLEKIQIDGDVSDWADGGFRLDVLNVFRGDRQTPDDGSARVRLGWDDDGLLVRADVKDSSFVEVDDADYWKADSIELFVAPAVGAPDSVQYLVSPGMTENQKELRHRAFDHRNKPETKDPKIAIEAARKAVDGGYVLEVRIPWTAVGIEPKLGQTAGFQFYCNDVDVQGGPRITLLWHPQHGAHASTELMRPIRLAEKPSPPLSVMASAGYEEHLRWVDVKVTAVPEQAGETVHVLHAIDSGLPVGQADKPSPDQNDLRALGEGKLALDGGWAVCTVQLDGKVETDRTTKTLVHVRGQLVPVTIPPRAAAVARKLLELRPVMDRCVFSGEELPKPKFAQPLVAEALLGPYEFKTTYYNAAFEPVTKADKPGRYGAVIEVLPKDGPKMTRYATLYRMPEAFEWWDIEYGGQLELPKELGVAPEVCKAQAKEIAEASKWFGVLSSEIHSGLAVLLAGLAETPADAPPATSMTGVEAKDRQWWVTLKRKLQGTDKRWPKGFVGPIPFTGRGARTLHEGTMEQAGMVEDAPERIDAVLTEWAGDTDEAFIAVVARNGVIVLHKAYGQRDGKPMTTETPSWMASLTKLIQGAGMMMLVGHGVVGLDEPIAKYLPAFEGRRKERPITVRDLFVHTAGMWDHWGDDVNDFDLAVGEYAPYLEVGKKSSYNGMDLAIVGKIMESVTGQSLPNFYGKFLFEPLGMTHTTATTGSWDARSTAMDMAKLGQMLASRGAYGVNTFFSEKTADTMLPVKLTMCLGEDTDTTWGIGCTWMGQEFFGPRTFGHGSAASATLRIDPDNNLVVSMTRNAAGKNFNKYHDKWLATIADCMIAPKLSDKAKAAKAERAKAAKEAEKK